MTAAEYENTSANLAELGYRPRVVSGYAIDGVAHYAAAWELDEHGLPWQARHGLTPAQYQTALDQMDAQGYRLVQVCGYQVNLDVFYAAIWERRAGPAWQTRYGLTESAYRSAMDDLTGQGYRLTWVSGYSHGGRARYAGIWELGPGPAWQTRHGLDAAACQLTADQLAAQGYAPVQLAGYGDGFV